MKRTGVIVFILAIYFMLASFVRAEYVMPYPSYMPGNTLYKVSRVLDSLKFYWSWGNIAQTNYHLALSDKYLIEAKTLMEYKQYLLSVDALGRSDTEFAKLPRFVSGAQKGGVNVFQLQELISAAAGKHEEILQVLLVDTPDEFTWTPEKAGSTQLQLGALIQRSIEKRQQIASETASL